MVGVVLNLAVWFGMQVLALPANRFNWFGAGVGLASFIAIQWVKPVAIQVITISGGLGLSWYLVRAFF